MTDISCAATMCPLFAAEGSQSSGVFNACERDGVAGSMDRFVGPVSWQLGRLCWPRQARALSPS